MILAKANLAEFSVSPTGVSSYFGPVRNPWALDRVTGGSSSGSAAAVATRMCFAALGTDSGGSVRLPASWCSLVGLKPTDGLVSNTGIIPSVATLDTCGPIARTVEDVAMMFGPMVGYDPLDVKSVASPDSGLRAARASTGQAAARRRAAQRILRRGRSADRARSRGRAEGHREAHERHQGRDAAAGNRSRTTR